MEVIRTAPLMLALVLSGCNSYTLMDQFQLPKSSGSTLSLSAQTLTLQQNGTTYLYTTGGTAPYSYAVLADVVSYNGGTGTYGAVSTSSPLSYTAGTSIGTLKVQVSDSLGATAQVIVSVLPPPPTTFTVSPSISPPQNTITWTYPDSSYITGFTLWYSGDGGNTYALASSATTITPTTLGPTTTTATDQGGSSVGRYYKLYAVSGSLQSNPVIAH